MESLDDVLSGDAVEEPETEQPEAETTGEEEAAPPAVDNETPKPEENAEVKAFKAQALDERRKRQALEARLKELEAKPKLEDGDYWDDPKKAIDTTKAELQQYTDGKIYTIAEELTRDAYTDYDEVIQDFLENYAETNPGIAETARTKANPHRYIYQETKKLKKLAEIGDIDKYEETLRAKIAAEEREKIKAELLADNRRPPPGSLANERAASGNIPTGNAESLEDILGR